MNGRRGHFVAGEGIPFLLASGATAGIAWYFGGALAASIPLAILVYLYLVFRDPHRKVSTASLGIVSPVDGKVVEVATVPDGVLGVSVQRITIRVTSFGTYTARSPVEGKSMDLNALSRPDAQTVAVGLWIQTDEGENVILQFRGNRFGIAPRAFLSYGERVGQGQRCANLRLTKFAVVELPDEARVDVTDGQRVSAAEDLLGSLPHP